MQLPRGWKWTVRKGRTVSAGDRARRDPAGADLHRCNRRLERLSVSAVATIVNLSDGASTKLLNPSHYDADSEQPHPIVGMIQIPAS
jgi:hypothetical protein